MPRVPAYQPNQVGPVQTTGARLRAVDNGGGIAGAIGQGLEGLSKVANAEVDRRIQVQNIADQAKAREQWLGFKKAGDEILAKTELARGLDASEAVKTATAELTRLRNEAGSAAKGNRPVMEMLTSQLDAQLANFQSDLSRHEKREVFTAAEATFKAQAETARDEAIKLWDRPDDARAHIEGGKAIIRQRADLLGYSEAQTAQEVAAFESATVRGTISSLAASGDYEATLAYADANSKRMTADDATAVAGMLRGVREERQAYSDAMSMIGAGVGVSDITVATGGKFSLPVAAGKVTSSFGASRSNGKSHNGVDWAAPKGTAVTPMAPGRVVSVSSDAQSGLFVVVDHGDGLTTSYSHLGRQDVKVGDTVGAGSVLGVVGMTGHTTGPHVHTVARRNGKTIDPVSLLGQTAAGGKTSGTGWDLKAGLAAIDRQPWSFERKQAAKSALQTEFSRRDAAEAREEREADREASGLVLRLGDGFRTLEQLPADLRERMSPSALAGYATAAEANSKARAVKAHGPEAMSLDLMRFYQPEAFKTLSLGQYAGKVTPAEMSTLLQQQAKMRTAPPAEWSPRAGIVTALNYGSQINGLKLEAEDKASILSIMEGEAWRLYQAKGKKPLTEAEYQSLFRSATREVRTKTTFLGIPTGEGAKPRYQIDGSTMPAATRSRLESRLRKAGLPVTEEAVLRLYRLEQ